MSSPLLRELKQTKPFTTLHEEAMVGMVRTTAGLENSFGDLLRQHGLSAAQFNVLRILRGAGEDGLSRNDIRDRLITRMPDVTRLLDGLEAMALVTRTRRTDDRRVVTTTITPSGIALVAQLDAPMVALSQHLFRHLSDTQLQTLLELLALVRSGTGDSSTDSSRP